MITKAQLKHSRNLEPFSVQWFYSVNISHPNQTNFTRVHHLIPTEPRLVLVAAMESMPCPRRDRRQTHEAIIYTHDAGQGEQLRLRPHVA
jgi:hypothetical protein